MKVTKNSVHPDLRGQFRMLNAARHMLGNRFLTSLLNAGVNRSFRGREVDGLDCSEVFVPSHDGKTKTRTRIYRPSNHEGDLPAMLYFHGGGYISGLPEQAGNEIKRFIETRPSVVIAPDYRLALEAPYPTCFPRSYSHEMVFPHRISVAHWRCRLHVL